MRRTLLAVLLVAVAGLSAGCVTLGYDTSSTLVEGPPGSSWPFTAVDVPAAFYGRRCSVHIHAVNDGDTVEGSDVVATSVAPGPGFPIIFELTARDVESVPNKVTDATGTLVMGVSFTVSAVFGPAATFSGTGTATYNCADPGPTR